MLITVPPMTLMAINSPVRRDPVNSRCNTTPIDQHAEDGKLPSAVISLAAPLNHAGPSGTVGAAGSRNSITMARSKSAVSPSTT